MTVYPVECPVVARIFADEASVGQSSDDARAEIGNFPSALDMVSSHKQASNLPVEEDVGLEGSFANRRPRGHASTVPATSQRHPTVKHRSTMNRISSKRSNYKKSLLVSPAVWIPDRPIFHSEARQFSSRIASPTLSEAENNLEEKLAVYFTSGTSLRWNNSVKQRACVKAYGPPPTLPSKSSKRQSRLTLNSVRLSRASDSLITSQPRHSRASAKGTGLRIQIPGKEQRLTNGMVPCRHRIRPKSSRPTLTLNVPESVILGIFRSRNTLDGLFVVAVLNRAFYLVFKRHELNLMKCALQKISPPT